MYAPSPFVNWQDQKTCADAVGNLPCAITQDAVVSTLSQAGQVRQFRYSFIPQTCLLVLPNAHYNLASAASVPGMQCLMLQCQPPMAAVLL